MPNGQPAKRKTHVLTERPPFECIALLLQGGGALGSYQAGVYQALAEANLHPDWVAGISIGAINSALIVGNPPEQATFCNTDPSWDLELAEFVECIRTGTPVRNGTSHDALETMRLVFGIYEADEVFDRRRALAMQDYA